MATPQDLCDRLWDICDKRKGEWEVERERIANEKWLEDHLGLITNTYLSLMQVQTIATFSFTDKGSLICHTHV